MATSMHNQQDGQRAEPNLDRQRTSVEKKPWVRPTLERRGTVAELVQITKKSGGNDFSGHKHLDD
jgi:hypothetical protein